MKHVGLVFARALPGDPRTMADGNPGKNCNGYISCRQRHNQFPGERNYCGSPSGAGTKKAKVALARKLAVIMHRMLVWRDVHDPASVAPARHHQDAMGRQRGDISIAAVTTS
jgi:hypothetical protein